MAAPYHQGGRHVVPVSKRLSADLLTPVSAFLLLRQEGRFPFLLESVEGGEQLARYSFLGRSPYRIVRAVGSSTVVTDGLGQPEPDAPEGDVFSVMEHLLARYQEISHEGLPRFRCGAVGFLGYDTVRLLEHLPSAPMPAGMPSAADAMWCFYNTIAAFDRVKHQIVLMSSVFLEPVRSLEEQYLEAVERILQLEAALHGTIEHPERVRLSDSRMRSNFERPAFEGAVEEGKRLIYEGDIFQVVLSQRFSLGFAGDAFNLYRALRQVNPSPYLFYLDFQEVVLIGSSPEVLVRVEDGRAQLLPIAGTRPRGATAEEDHQLADELLKDPKERAEHLMLVDLGRNDLGRVCSMGSVKVDRYAYIERYSHVMHIVSAISGDVASGMAAMDVLRACFPAGTVSGAPKVRAMQIIDALEPDRRGVYAGAVGYIDFSGNMDTCIAIRTMVIEGSTISVQAGAGVVADSDPAREYEETENKARALKHALHMAADGLL